MMMTCLKAGGIDPAMSVRRDESTQGWNDKYYKPNPESLYELMPEQVEETGFPQMCGGKSVKILGKTLNGISVGKHKYKIIFMLRHPEEIRQSSQAFLSRAPAIVCKRPMDFDAPYYAVMEDIVDIAKQRRDVVDLVTLNYRDVVRDPVPVFEDLAERGWPIDPKAAASVVDAKYYRFRLERLAVGA